MAPDVKKDSKLSVLISARRNSKYLAKFLFGLLQRTYGLNTYSRDIEVLVMLNEHDTWNSELVSYFSEINEVTFFRENKQLGRAGLHEYFNDLAKHASGDWLIYFCEDHFIVQDNWDVDFRSIVRDLNSRDIWCIVPKFDNAGAMNHILSRGYYEAIGGVIGRHGWIDSYINDLNAVIPERVIRIDQEWFHDFTHDKPEPMSPEHTKVKGTDKGLKLPKYDSEENRNNIAEDRKKLLQRIEKGR